jgi:hypothetical protein
LPDNDKSLRLVSFRVFPPAAIETSLGRFTLSVVKATDPLRARLKEPPA